ncbi:MAG: HDOD domain-containing protein [Gammaproteobacteria bacterium]|nr:MAG: HDOD domain-containing protein [Gammaproteobacteria bacterium]
MSQTLDVETFPTLPYIAHEILSILNKYDSDIDEIAGMISKEPSLTARIVATANSAFYSGQRPIYSIDDAIVRLGLNRVKVLASSILLADSFDASSCPLFKLDEYWYIAVQVSFCASKIVKVLGSSDQADAAYLAGLLHNIGLLLLVHIFPDEMAEVFKNLEKDPKANISDYEIRLLGCDHHQSGRMLLSEWQLPEESIAVAEFYGVADYSGEYAELVKVIAFCREWVISGFDQEYFTDYKDHEILESIDLPKLEKIRSNCIEEEEKVRSFAQLLSN